MQVESSLGFINNQWAVYHVTALEYTCIDGENHTVASGLRMNAFVLVDFYRFENLELMGCGTPLM